jgi:hypothetical protein
MLLKSSSIIKHCCATLARSELCCCCILYTHRWKCRGLYASVHDICAGTDSDRYKPHYDPIPYLCPFHSLVICPWSNISAKWVSFTTIMYMLHEHILSSQSITLEDARLLFSLGCVSSSHWCRTDGKVGRLSWHKASICGKLWPSSPCQTGWWSYIVV